MTLVHLTMQCQPGLQRLLLQFAKDLDCRSFQKLPIVQAYGMSDQIDAGYRTAGAIASLLGEFTLKTDELGDSHV